MKTAEAYRLKMKFQDIYETCNDITTAKIAINEWILLAEESRIEPIMQFADTALPLDINYLMWYNQLIRS